MAAVALGPLGCTSVIVEEDGEETADDSDQPSPTPDPPLDWWNACPAPAGLESLEPTLLGTCSNEPAEGTLTLQNATDLLYRIVHEAGHISSGMAGTDGGLFSWTQDGGELVATTDDGYAIGLVSSKPGPDAGACAVLEFGCWTGGHGGWGPSALAGLAYIEVALEQGEVTHVRIVSSSMWLVESQPLSGTPPTAVAVELSIASGEVASVDAHVGEHHIVR